MAYRTGKRTRNTTMRHNMTVEERGERDVAPPIERLQNAPA
jgi:hypothetical protein